MTDRIVSAYSFSTFASVFAAGVLASNVPVLLSKSNHGQSKISAMWHQTKNSASRNARVALLPTILPPLYRYLNRLVAQNPKAPKDYMDTIPPVLASPAFLLLPERIRIQVAAYLLSTYFYSLLWPGESEPEGKSTPQESTEPTLGWRKYVPPVWTLTFVGNTWLLWAFLYENQSFPKGYQSIIVDHSRHYLPQGRPVKEVLSVIQKTSHPLNKTGSPHTYLTCATLHPAEPSCTKNFVKGYLEESWRTLPFVGVFTAATLAVKAANSPPGVQKFVLQWLQNTGRGTSYISGSITTAWAITCVLQRVLSEGTLTKARWILNGSLCNIWIFLLPKGRQDVISLYIARLAALSYWNTQKSKGGKSLRYGEIALIALAWAGLLRIRKNNAGGKIQGPVGKVLRYIEGEGTDRPNTDS